MLTFKQFLLSEGDVIKGKFVQHLRAKKGMYKHPDIKVPEGFVRFEVEPIGKKGGKIVGITKDGKRKTISTTSSFELANVLASAYNAGGYTNKDIMYFKLGEDAK